MEQSVQETPPENTAKDENQVMQSCVDSITSDFLKIETKSGSIRVDIRDEKNSELWIFGYGSLLWRPNFEYNLKLVGSIKGYKRRFWQGNTFHRGTEEHVARVATLIPMELHENNKCMDPIDEKDEFETLEQEYTTFGYGFQCKGNKQILEAISHLNVRETKLGGYDVVLTEFYPIMRCNKKIDCLVFMATIENPIYQGPASSSLLAEKICHATGACGTNVEYLFKLCQWHKSNIPQMKDIHLFNIEAHCLYIIRDKIHELENISRSITPTKDLETTNWLSEPWVKSYIELTKMTSSINCTCHDCPGEDPAAFFGEFGPHYS